MSIRPLIKMRVTRPRKEFGVEGVSFIEMDAGEKPGQELKKITTNMYFTKKNILEIGL